MKEITHAGFVIHTWLVVKIVRGLPAEEPLYFYKHLMDPILRQEVKDISSNSGSISCEHKVLGNNLGKIYTMLIA